MGTLRLRLPESLHRRVQELAQKGGISIHQFIATAVAEKLSTLLTEESLETRTRRGSRQGFERALEKVRDAPPDPQDAL
jgi:hypothetical protein